MATEDNVAPCGAIHLLQGELRTLETLGSYQRGEAWAVKQAGEYRHALLVLTVHDALVAALTLSDLALFASSRKALSLKSYEAAREQNGKALRLAAGVAS